MTDCFLSIIIPCYNIAPYLPKGFEQFKSMECLDETELIFIDDGSTDETLSLLNSFSREIPQVRVISQINRGVSAARNAGIAVASGKYMLMLDGDDYLTPDAIQIIKEKIGESDALLTPITIVNSNGQKVEPLQIKEGEYSVIDLYNSCPFFPTLPMLVYRTDIIKRHKIFFSPNIHAGEVYTFTCEYLQYSNTIHVACHSFYLYNVRPTSATHSHNFAKDLSILNAIDRILTHSKPDVTNIPSFTLTLFLLGTFFTYNKYSKLGLKNDSAIASIHKVLNHENMHSCIKKVATNSRKWNKHKLLAIYILLTGIWGYKFLASIFAIFRKLMSIEQSSELDLHD